MQRHFSKQEKFMDSMDSIIVWRDKCMIKYVKPCQALGRLTFRLMSVKSLNQQSLNKVAPLPGSSPGPGCTF